jgi:murein DD-endopeptidase MepM/ murein hydrolase activator NlpD
MKKRYKLLIGLSSLILVGFLFPEPKSIPVAGATKSDWNKDSFWYEPWGASGVHKGVDVFASKGTSVVAATNMLVLYNGHIRKGGKIVVGLGPKWRLHYFAHLESFESNLGLFAPAGTKVGTVGDSGNAKGKQPHLHFSILSLLPLPWLVDGSTQGFKKAFYLNPIKYFGAGNS